MSIQQIGVALTARAHYTNSGANATGLTVTCDVRGPAGTEIVTAGACTEIGDGIYEYELSSGLNDAAGLYTFVFDTAGTVDQRNLPGQWTVGQTWVENLNATISSRSSHSAADVWAVGTRTLTSFGTLASDTATAVWAAGARTLTSFGSLASDTATAVWAAATRTLTSFGTLASDVWAVATRTLTAGTNIVLAKGTGITGFTDATPAEIDAELTSSHGAGGWTTADVSALALEATLDSAETAILAAIVELADELNVDAAAIANAVANRLRGEISILRSPVESQSEITIRVADDYLDTYGRAFSFTLTGQPELVGGTANLAIAGIRIATGSVTDGGTDDDGNTVQNVTIEVTDTESLLLAGSEGIRKPFTVQITVDSKYMTEFSGFATVLRRHPASA